MAQIVTRTAKAGAKSFQVKWRHGVDKTWQTVTVGDEGDAKALKGAVEARRHMVRKTDPDVLDFSIVTGLETRSTAPLFEVVAEEYISGRRRANADTKLRNRARVAKYLADWHGRPVDVIDEPDVHAVLNRMEAEGLSIRHVFELMGSIFKYAVRRGYITVSPTADVVIDKRKKKRKPTFLEHAEAGLLVTHADERIKDPVRVYLKTGLRYGELMGLHVEDYIRPKGAKGTPVRGRAALNINRAAKMPTVAEPEYTIGELKTEFSRRVVAVDEETAVILDRLCEGKRPGDLIFPNPHTGGIWANVKFNMLWRKAVKAAQAAGLTKTPRVHDLRHTHAAWVLSAGGSIFALSRRLGHASITITADIYGHLTQESDDAMRAITSGFTFTVVPGGKTDPDGTAVTAATGRAEADEEQPMAA